MAAGCSHGLGLKADGSIVAWGDNSDGQCDVPAPNPQFRAVAAGNGTSFVLKADGSIVAWGNNTHGQCDVPAPNADFITVVGSGSRSLAIRNIDTALDPATPDARPRSASLLRAWPNPFNPTTTVEYELVQYGPVHIELYDLAGRLARVLASGERAAGRHTLRVEGEGLASGLYLLKLTTPQETRGLKLALLR